MTSTRNIWAQQTETSAIFPTPPTQVVTETGAGIDVDNIPTVVWAYGSGVTVTSTDGFLISVIQGHPLQ